MKKFCNQLMPLWAGMRKHVGFRRSATPCLQSFRHLGKCTRGSIAPVFGMVSIVLMLGAGMAVDYSRLYHTRSKLADALDAALIRTGNMLLNGEQNRGELRRQFSRFLAANTANALPFGQQADIYDFRVDVASGKIVAGVSSPVATTFMQLTGRDEVVVAADASVQVNIDPVEVAMALDVTGSMAGSKLEALKTGAGNAIDILIGDQPNPVARVGLVPYSASVNAGPRIAALATGNASQKCVVERSRDNRYNNAGPAREKIGADLNAYCPDVSLLPLSANKKRLQRQINALQAGGGTAGHLGVGWAYYLLSSSWNRIWPADARAAPPEDTTTRKIAILMSDGEFNTAYRDESSAEIAMKTCQDMKRNGIEVYSIAFSIESDNPPPDEIERAKQARQTLQGCASPDTLATRHFHDAKSEDELVLVFQDIANSIRKFRLVK